MFQMRRFRVVQPAMALASVNDGIREEGWGGQVSSAMRGMVQYLGLLFLLAKTLQGVFRELRFRHVFKLRLDGLQSKPSVG
jgi:hypothetical protein